MCIFDQLISKETDQHGFLCFFAEKLVKNAKLYPIMFTFYQTLFQSNNSYIWAVSKNLPIIFLCFVFWKNLSRVSYRSF